MMQISLPPSKLGTEVPRGRRWRSEPHTTPCYKTISPPRTEPWMRQQKLKLSALPLDHMHIGKLIWEGGRFWKFRRAVTGTPAGSKRGLKASTSSKVVTQCTWELEGLNWNAIIPPLASNSPSTSRMRCRAFPLRMTTRDYASLRIVRIVGTVRTKQIPQRAPAGQAPADSGIAHQHTRCVSSRCSCPKAQASRTCGG